LSSESASAIREIFGSDFGAVGNLTHSFMVKYNKEIANDPKVKYFSWAGEIDAPTAIFLLGSYRISGYIFAHVYQGPPSH